MIITRQFDEHRRLGKTTEIAVTADGTGVGSSGAVGLRCHGREGEREGIDTTRSWQQHVGPSKAKMVCAAGARSSQFCHLGPGGQSSPSWTDIIPGRPACSSRSTRASRPPPPTVWRRSRTEPHAQRPPPLPSPDLIRRAHAQLNAPPTLQFVILSNEQSGFSSGL